MDKQQITEIHFTDEQALAIQKAVQKETKKEKGFWNCVKRSLLNISNSFISLIISILTLKNTGKWISVITISVVLLFFGKFLIVHAWSYEAMKLIAPILGQIGVVVFSVIGGFKGATSIVEKVNETKKITESDKKDIMKGG